MEKDIKEIAALIEHILSFLCTALTIYFNNNGNIQFLAFADMIQHGIKIIRIFMFNFRLSNAPLWFCFFHSLLNDFSRNAVVTLSCVVIFSLYSAIKLPVAFSKYHKKIRPYLYTFIVLYIGGFSIASVYEPIFKVYDDKELKQRDNCPSGYKNKFYQYIISSTAINIPFVVPALFCAMVIFYKIKSSPKNALRNQISIRTDISFTKWLKIVTITSLLSIISLVNLYYDIRKGLDVEKGKKEVISLDVLYYITASSGILIMLFTISRSQIDIKKKKNEPSESDFDYDYNINRNSMKLNKTARLSYSRSPTSQHIKSPQMGSPNQLNRSFINDSLSNSDITNNNYNMSFNNSPVMNSPVMNSPVMNSPIINSPVISNPIINSPLIANNIDTESPVMHSTSMIYFKNILNSNFNSINDTSLQNINIQRQNTNNQSLQINIPSYKESLSKSETSSPPICTPSPQSFNTSNNYDVKSNPSLLYFKQLHNDEFSNTKPKNKINNNKYNHEININVSDSHSTINLI